MDPKDRQNITTLDLVKNKLISDGWARNQHLSFKYVEFNLYLREIIFVTDVAVLTIETTKLVFKPLDIFWRFWNTR